MAEEKSKRSLTPVLVVLLVVASFLIGSLYTKVQVLEKGVEEGVTGTPGTIILTASGNTQLIPGALPFEQVKPMIDAALKK